MATDGDIPGYEFMNSEGLHSIDNPGVGLTREGFRRLHLGVDSLVLKPVKSQDYPSAVEELKTKTKEDPAFTHNEVGESCRKIVKHFSGQMTEDGDPANGCLRTKSCLT